MTSLDDARALDAADPLRAFRDRFSLPDGVIYLDGNSLGALPKATPERLRVAAEHEWGEGLIRSWNDADWIGAPVRVGGKIASLIGAKPNEVVVADSTSVNIFKLLSAAVKARPGRPGVLYQAGDFPTDGYMAEGLAALVPGVEPRAVAAEVLADAIDDSVAVVLLSHVHYKTGARWDMAALTARAHAAGALIVWDLSHAGGAIAVDLNGCDADMAVGCGYKFLNGGPGAPAFLFVAERLHGALTSPLTGWMGHAAGFDFELTYRPAPGVERFMSGTPSVLGLLAFEVGVDLAMEATIPAVEAKARALWSLFAERMAARCAPFGFECLTTADGAARGSHIAYAHPEGYAIMRTLIARGVIGDFRKPDVLRFGLTPLYLGFEDVWRAVEILAEIMETQAWRDAPAGVGPGDLTLNVYFLGIAGAGMSALASVLVSEGHAVSGSDSGVFPPVTDYLDRLGIPWRDGFDAALVPTGLDAAVVGGSAKLDLARNPELVELKRRGVPLYSFPAFLGRHTQGRRNAVIAGSFGKSTLTALCAVLMREAGRDPGYFIGAVPLDLPTTGHGGADPVFLMEGDEYVTGPDDRRSKFAYYHPDAVLLSSLVHDHVNVFPTMADYEAPFAGLIADLPADGLLVCAHAFEPLHRLTRGRDVVWYGLDPCPGYHADGIAIGEVTTFELVTPGGMRIALRTELLGLHNIENIVGAAAFLLERGEIDVGALQRGVARFRGVARRLDKKTAISRVPVYEGFGSSYEKARSAIEAILLHFPGRPAVVVFEPHTFSWRDRAALGWYDTVFEGVSRVLLLPPPTHGAHDQLGAPDILERIADTGVAVTHVTGADEAIADLDTTLAGDEVVLLLSSGPLDGLPASLPPVMDRRFG